METLDKQIRPRDLVAAHLYPNEEAAVQDALQHLLQVRPDIRIAWAVHLYATNEDLSLAKAAALAGLGVEAMKDALTSQGVELRLGPATLEEARAEVAVAERLFHAPTH